MTLLKDYSASNIINEKDKRLPEDMGFDPKTNRLYTLLEGYGGKLHRSTTGVIIYLT